MKGRFDPLPFFSCELSRVAKKTTLEGVVFLAIDLSLVHCWGLLTFF